MKLNRKQFKQARIWAFGLFSLWLVLAQKQVYAKPPTEVAVSALQLKPQNYEHYISFIGQTSAARQIQLYSYAPGRVLKLKKSEGERVSKGESLCDIESNRNFLSLKVAKLNEKIASDAVKRTKAHLNKGTSTRRKGDIDQLNHLDAKMKVIDERKTYVGSLCRVPFSGVITERSISLHDEVQPKSPTFHIAALDLIRVKVQLSERDYRGFKVGHQASLSLDEQFNTTISGKIISLSKRANSRTKSFVMTLEFKNSNNFVLLNTSVYVKVLKNSYSDIIMIPEKSLLGEAGKHFVYLVSDKKAVKKDLKVGPLLEGNYLVHAGLESGDKVVVQGASFIKHGQAIKVTKVN